MDLIAKIPLQEMAWSPILVDTEDEKPKLGDSGAPPTTDPDDVKPPSKGDHKRYKVEVLVPTMELLRQERIKQEDYKKLDKMKNPKIKKLANLVFNPDTLRARFQALGPKALDLYPITLDKASQDFMVSRQFMSTHYGGSMQTSFPEISQRHKDNHGMDDFMYSHPNYQPVAPQVPGACGLFFNIGRSSIGREWPKLQRVFTRIEAGIWQYMGMYRLTSSPSLTRREWLDQEPKVRKTWGKELSGRGWGSTVRARVFARKRLGREPTDEEFEDLYEEGRRQFSVTPEEIIAAFSNGEEELAIWLMECVGYDNAFQMELTEKFALHVPPPKTPRGSGKSSRNKRTTAGRNRNHEENFDSDSQSDNESEIKGKSSPKKTKVAGRKRKRDETPDFDSENNDERASTGRGVNFDDLSEDEDRGPTYTPRGTRSRPIVI